MCWNADRPGSMTEADLGKEGGMAREAVPPIWSSAPELSDLSEIIGTRDQVLAALLLQERWRVHAARIAMAAPSSSSFSADEAVPADEAVALEAEATREEEAASDEPLSPFSPGTPCPLPAMVINLDTGCAISIAELLELYGTESADSNRGPVFATKWQRCGFGSGLALSSSFALGLVARESR